MALCRDCGTRLAGVTSTRCGTCGWMGFPEREAMDDGMQRLGYLPAADVPRYHTGVPGLDYVLSGGLPRGHVALLAGEPGMGKSTLLLQAAGHLGRRRTVLYVHAEEEEEAIGARAARLGIEVTTDVVTTAETSLAAILARAQRCRARVVFLDPIQCIWTGDYNAAGSIQMLRDVCKEFVGWCKETRTSAIMSCHMDKDGKFAGPKVIQHIPDSHLEYVGIPDGSRRELRIYKNRSGESGRVAWLEMTATGLRTADAPPAEVTG